MAPVFPPGFAIVDVETTGLRPTLDRVVELAIVRTDIQGSVIAELVTLINPERSPGATFIHGISAEDLEGAPLFAEVVPELYRFLEGALLVGHNVKFDAAFLDAELVRAGKPFPRAPHACTRELAMRYAPALGDYRLASCCRAFGVTMGQEHRALEDARAAASLLVKFVGDPILGKELSNDVASVQTLEWPRLATPVRLVTRGAGEKKKEEEGARLRDAISGLPAGKSGKNLASFQALVDEILEDRRVTAEDAEQARALAEAEGLFLDDVLDVFRAQLAFVAAQSLVKDLEGGAGASDVARVASLLGLSAQDVASSLADAAAGIKAPAPPTSKPLRAGMSVCFSGDTIPAKDLLEWRGREAGLRVLTGVSKKLDVLVVDDPYSVTSKAQKARALGTRMLVVPVFLSLLSRLTQPDKP